MGITRECLEIYARLVENDYLDWHDCKVMELGSQTVHFDDPAFFSKWARRVGVAQETVASFPPGLTGQHFHTTFGHQYNCIDLDDNGGTIDILRWDLNHTICPADYRMRYDLVTNLGTTEHLINQASVFKLMHDLTRVGGILFNLLPMAQHNHGFFNYNPCLFEWMAHSNAYKILGLYTSKDLLFYQQQDLIPYGGRLLPDHEYIFCVMRKTSASDFVNPAQLYDRGKMEPMR